MAKLKRGELIPLTRERNSWWSKAWEYRINNFPMATIYKQQLPRATEFIYKFTLAHQILPVHWKSVPQGKMGVVGGNYETLKECRIAMKRAILAQIKYFNSMIELE